MDIPQTRAQTFSAQNANMIDLAFNIDEAVKFHSIIAPAVIERQKAMLLAERTKLFEDLKKELNIE